MRLSTQLWQENQDIAQACLAAPFVCGIADGSLDRSLFSHYVGQDVFFLQTFARAYTIAGAKAPDWDGFCELHQLADGVSQELELHASFATAWSVDTKTASIAPSTRHYTDFVMATAWGYGTGMIVTALTPCMRLYAWLGRQLAAQGITAKHPYTDWIRTYSAPDFEDLALRLEVLTDTYAMDNEQIHQTYRYAMHCELDFFQAAVTWHK
ncbi:MAG: TenA family protein [Desulfoplanes sp.]